MRFTSFLLGAVAVAAFTVGCDGPGTGTEPRLGSPAVEPAFAEVGGPSAATEGLGPVFHFHGQSHFADASFFEDTPNGFVFGFVSVSKERNNVNPVTFLFYSIVQCDFNFNCSALEEGFGTIPDGDVRFGRSTAQLSTNTSFEANPDFFRLSGDGGPIDVEWQEAPFFSSQVVLNEQAQFGGIKIRRHENRTFSAAFANGTIVTIPLSADGAMGSSNINGIDISVANVVASASGSGHFTSGGERRTFSFHALQMADGSARGEWQRYNRALDARAHGKVTCMTLAGSEAWLGGFTTSSTTGPAEVVWRVRDGGPGGRDDAVSLQSTGGPTEPYCFGQPSFPELHPIESGNIQVDQ